jgi:hypothetical protein
MYNSGMQIPEPIRELRPHATWDLIREGIKMMLPFLAGLGITQWVSEYKIALMWAAAILVAAAIAYWDRLPRRTAGLLPLSSQRESSELTQLRSEVDRLNAHRVDLLGTISALKDQHVQHTASASSLKPSIGLTLHQTVVEAYDNTPGRHYPRKVRMYFSNDGDEIQLGKAKWIAEGIGIQKGKPGICMYEFKDHHLGKFSGETDTKLVPPGKWFRLYVGLDSSISEDEIQLMKAENRLGVLQIPVRLSGVDMFIQIRP